ncbi:unnamed protein product [Taenia asiatica]|uniref:Uncharacterized protein n=1 Tax=Taenia asiatica TaxID=60517 RepID=A0A0R3VZC5_TAEAS|nr:unnamed protein product [Taenia asiatica]
MGAVNFAMEGHRCFVSEFPSAETCLEKGFACFSGVDMFLITCEIGSFVPAPANGNWAEMTLRVTLPLSSALLRGLVVSACATVLCRSSLRTVRVPSPSLSSD